MPNDNEMLKYNHGEKSLKAPFIIYTDLECLYSCQNNFEKSYTEKKIQYTPSGYSIFTNCSFDEQKTNLIVTKVNMAKVKT